MAQFVQTDADAANKPPRQDVQEAALEFETEPGAQAVHVAELVAPANGENVPTGQAEQTEAPVRAWKAPEGQTVQLAAP